VARSSSWIAFSVPAYSPSPKWNSAARRGPEEQRRPPGTRSRARSRGESAATGSALEPRQRGAGFPASAVNGKRAS
jgi:hypothetical protein